MALANCINHHRNRVMHVTDKASILYYTVIDLILLGAHDGGTGEPDQGRQRTFCAADPRPRAATTRNPGLCAPARELHLVWRVNESDAAIRVEVDPPDGHAPRISDSHPSYAS
jgi:hypothetical protein